MKHTIKTNAMRWLPSIEAQRKVFESVNVAEEITRNHKSKLIMHNVN